MQNHYSLDYLKPFYECKICNDTGFVTDNNYNTTMCNCLKQKLLDVSINKSNMYNLNKENFDNFNELIFSDEVDLSKYKTVEITYSTAPDAAMGIIRLKRKRFLEIND